MSSTSALRHWALYIGLLVLGCQLVFVYAFFPPFESARGQLASATASNGAAVEQAVVGGTYSEPDLLQWSGAHSLVWVASLFAPSTSVRLAPALVFFFVAGGFLTALHRTDWPEGLLAPIAASGRAGMRMWLSWLAGAFLLLVYLVTSAGGMTALRVAAGITFEKSWKDIGELFLSHWLVYVAWFALAAIIPMAGGVILGLIRTRFLTWADRDVSSHIDTQLKHGESLAQA